MVGLSHRLAHFPAQLSGGECQRVAIARAIISEPKLILADEPSGNLDDKTGKEIMDLLFRLCRDRGQTLILVTHNHELAKACDRTLILKAGKFQAIK
jgi:putative ABC transport system ATP-binding protein